MTILFLGPVRPELFARLKQGGDNVVPMEEKITAASECVQKTDFLVSFGYRYKVTPDVLARFGWRAINLHISLLPWNQGADPNLWSFLENTPKGVTIHAMTERI